jgi:hypothetical protein
MDNFEISIYEVSRTDEEVLFHVYYPSGFIRPVRITLFDCRAMRMSECDLLENLVMQYLENKFNISPDVNFSYR